MLKANNVSSKNSTPTKAGDAEGGAPASSAAKKRGSRAAGNPAEDTPTKKRARPAKAKTVKKESDDEKDTKPPKEPKAESAVKDQSDSELSGKTRPSELAISTCADKLRWQMPPLPARRTRSRMAMRVL